MYPNEQGAKFDYAYYKNTHMKLVEEAMKPHGLIRVEVDKGVSGGGGQPAPYIGVGHLYFQTADGYDKAIAEKGAQLRGDIPNFTNVTPTRQISEILE
jgi:uncharacterized protein (TIGR02118 family)